jgi:hypothetical protein
VENQVGWHALTTGRAWRTSLDSILVFARLVAQTRVSWPVPFEIGVADDRRLVKVGKDSRSNTRHAVRACHRTATPFLSLFNEETWVTHVEET